jgi:hypothetical protein
MNQQAYTLMIEALEGLLENGPEPKGIKKDFRYILHREAARKALRLAKTEDNQTRGTMTIPLSWVKEEAR